ncbi:MAG: TFIIB-type zinc ribbon-containing protein [Bacilli bacterium]|nr:TFIIB-type zinc ribbon-containing protein [Bacilli bacterium]
MKEDNKVQSSNSNEKTVVQTDKNQVNGQDKCPKCGSTDISPSKNGKLRCNFCRCEFEPEKLEGMVEDISKLEGQVVTSGLQDIQADAKDVITLKCSSCGAEVVIDTASSAQARCHWCRNTLSLNAQIPNGSVPDEILPFKITKEDARTHIETFVHKRRFFAHPQFKKEFTTENIMGVYFPYMLVDVNGHANFVGEGEHEKRAYYVGSGDNRQRRYDADVYHVERDFDITINELSIESNSDRLDNSSKEKTNNIINSIMPFDTENCVKYNANYLKGYTSEKRDTNVEQLKDLVNTQATDIARFAANDSLQNYDRGVAWSSQNLSVKGQQWKAAYLPVWLYSYQQKKGDKSLLHYVAVNARTEETMGSVPIHQPRLIFISAIIEILGIIAMLFVEQDYRYFFLAFGIVYYIIMYLRYRNSDARHTYEKETKREIKNLKTVDTFIKTRNGLSNSTIVGANNTSVNGTTNKGMLNSLTGNKFGDSVINAALGDSVVGSVVKKSIEKKNSNKDQ